MTNEENKKTVLRFNKEFLQGGNSNIPNEIVAIDFTNHTAPAGTPQDMAGLIQFVAMLHKGFSDIRIDIHERLAEGDLVATRKVIHAKHTGEIMGHTATGKQVQMNVIDSVRLRDGK